MKQKMSSKAITLLLLMFAGGLHAQNVNSGLDQLSLAEKYLCGTWRQVTNNDTVDCWELERHGNALTETDYILVDGVKTIYSYWVYNYSPARKDFSLFASYVYGGSHSGIGSFTEPDTWHQDIFETSNPQKLLRRADFIFEDPTNLKMSIYNPSGQLASEGKYTKINTQK